MTNKKCKAIFTRPKKISIVSSIVRYLTGEKYSHCAWVINIDELPNSPLVYHASKFNVHFITFEKFLEKNEVVYEFEFEYDREEYLEMLKYCFDHLGEPYDFFGLIFNPVFRLLKIKNEVNICSELVIRIIKHKIHFYGEIQNIIPEEVKIAIENYKELK